MPRTEGILIVSGCHSSWSGGFHEHKTAVPVDKYPKQDYYFVHSLFLASASPDRFINLCVFKQSDRE